MTLSKLSIRKKKKFQIFSFFQNTSRTVINVGEPVLRGSGLPNKSMLRALYWNAKGRGSNPALRKIFSPIDIHLST